MAEASDRVPPFNDRLAPQRGFVCGAAPSSHRHCVRSPTESTADDRHGRALSDGFSRDASDVGHGFAGDRPCRSAARRPAERTPT
jgi:hypothetical protein